MAACRGRVALDNEQPRSAFGLADQVKRARLTPAFQQQLAGPAIGRPLGLDGLHIPQLAGCIVPRHEHVAGRCEAHAVPLHALAHQVGAGAAFGAGCPHARGFVGCRAVALRCSLGLAHFRCAAGLALRFQLGSGGLVCERLRGIEGEPVALCDSEQGAHLHRAGLAGTLPCAAVFRRLGIGAPRGPGQPQVGTGIAQPIEHGESDSGTVIVRQVIWRDGIERFANGLKGRWMVCHSGAGGGDGAARRGPLCVGACGRTRRLAGPIKTGVSAGLPA